MFVSNFPLLQTLQLPELELLAVAWWLSWTSRNQVLWNQASFYYMFIANKSLQTLKDIGKQKQTTPTSVRLEEHRHWKLPPRGRLKINCDGSYSTQSGSGGVVVIVRDETGVGITAAVRPFRYAHSALHTEFEACRLGLSIAKQQGWTEVDMESDSLILVAAMKDGQIHSASMDSILEDCRNIARGIRSFSIRFIHRSGNGVADYLAHLAKGGPNSNTWLEALPICIQEHIRIELLAMCYTERGTCITSLSFQTLYDSYINQGQA